MPTIPLEVVDVVDPDPTFRRLRFSGAGIAPLAAAEAADAYLKLVFFPEGGRPEGPVDLKEFRAREPRESHPTVRTYTIRSADAAGGTIDVDFARHGHAGVACGWAEAARPGDVVHALGPGGRFAPDPTADALVLIGDESAFPAVCRSLEAAADPGSVVVVLESADEAHSHPRRSLILKALTGEPVEPTTVTREARVGDRYLQCSDGLSDPVSFDTIAETLSTGNCGDAADRLVALALRSGGPDNVTVVVADVVTASAGVVDEPVVVGAASADDPVDAPSGADTAAGRAAAFSRAQQAAEPAPGARATPETIDPADSEDDDRTRRPGSRRRFAVSVLGVLLLLVGIGAVSAVLVRSNYFVAAADSQVVVKRGITGDILGLPLAKVDQIACLSADGELSMHASAVIPPGCNVLTLGDLSEPAREGVRAGLPSGSREEASAQITRLAEENLLPPCPAPGSDTPRATGARPGPGAGSTERSTTAATTTGSPSPTPAPAPGRGTGTDPSPTTAAGGTATTTPVPGQDCRAVS